MHPRHRTQVVSRGKAPAGLPRATHHRVHRLGILDRHRRDAGGDRDARIVGEALGRIDVDRLDSVAHRAKNLASAVQRGAHLRVDGAERAFGDQPEPQPLGPIRHGARERFGRRRRP